MATVALPGSPPGLVTIGCGTNYCRCALFIADDEGLISGVSSPTGLTASSTTQPPIPRHKSAFRVRLIESQHVAEQHTANSKKIVHFDDSFEKTRFFLPADAPASKPTSTAWGAHTPGPICGSHVQLSHEKRFCLLNPTFDVPSPWQPIRLQSLALSHSEHETRGTVAVLNLAFQKEVSARFTLDKWKTASDVTAEHRQSLYLRKSIVSDLFSFTIDRKSLPLSTGNLLHVCVRYRVLGDEFWDNNGGMNYQVSLTA